MKNIAIITAGGSGRRMGTSTKKQFIKLGNDPVIVHTIKKFTETKMFAEIILVLPSDSIDETQKILKKYFTDDKITLVAGGRERQESVFNGLKACPNDTNYVFIHDGVRPFIDDAELMKLLEKAMQEKAAIPVTPVRYTVKRCRHNNVITTIPREELFEVHTPQVFDYSLILHLHEKAAIDGINLTDDAGLCEFYGHEVGIVVSSSFNMKITHPQDLKVAEIMLEVVNKK
jgi:2-C-methyl-D-erythritol 4-phosphate cytidylyltransferase